MRVFSWVPVMVFCAAFSFACSLGETPAGGDGPSKDAPAKGGKSGKKGKGGKSGKGAKPGGGDAGGGAVTCAQVVKAWAPIYEGEFPDQGKVDQPRLTKACTELGEIDTNQDGAKCWLTAKGVMDCEWGPNWLDDGIVYDGWG